MSQLKKISSLSILSFFASFFLLCADVAAKADPKPMSDQDLLDPKKLTLNVAAPYLDSFDSTRIGSIFITKRAAVGSADRKYGGYFGEKGSPAYKRACMLFCPPGTKELDAVYFYLIEERGDCSIAVRAIGWGETDTEYKNGREYKSSISYRSTPTNIKILGINGNVVEIATDFSQLEEPQGTNSKYFPRNKGLFGLFQSTQTSADLKAGYITTIHYFPADKLIKALPPLSNESVSIQFPDNTWLPSQIVIDGDQLKELKKVVDKCDSDY